MENDTSEDRGETRMPLKDKIKNAFKRFFGAVLEVLKKFFLIQRPETNGFSERSAKTVRVIRTAVCVILGFLVLYYGYLMILKGPAYRREAYEVQNRTFVTKAKRGNIYDASGNALAITIDTATVSVSRKEINEYGSEKYKDGDLEDYRKLVARGLSDILDINYDKILEGLRTEGNYWNVATDVAVEKGEEVKAWVTANKLKGISVDSDTARYYPYGSLASHVLGFTGVDDKGLVCGIEVALNEELSGRDGRVVAKVEQNGNAITGEMREVIEELQNGYSAKLTVETGVQAIVEEVLDEAVRDFGALEGGAAIVMDPSTGSVLAMASNPSFDLNDPMEVPEGLQNKYFYEPPEDADGNSFLQDFIWRNRALASAYEPGSTFKAFTASIALEENVVGVEETVSDDPLSLAGWTIHCSTGKATNGHGNETFRLAVANSCNPVMARVALRTGVDTFYRYVRSFGFMNKTNILLSGEMVGLMHTDPSEIDLAVTAFGQRFTITPIQLATAYCAIANGGTLYEPRVVESLLDENGNVVRSYPPKEVRQVISSTTSKTVLELLEGVVSIGTGGRAYVTGYKVAGKTGTSETVDTERTGRYVVSFCAVAPSDRPEIVVLVMLDHPTMGDVSGSRMGAWAAGKIIKKVLEYKQVKKIYTEDDFARVRNVYYADDLSGQTFIDAMNWVKTSSRLYNVVVVGEMTDNAVVKKQYPAAGVYTAREGTLVLYLTDDEDAGPGYVKVPNVVGLNLCEAQNVISAAELNMDCRGGDIITWQSIEPGEDVLKGTVIIMKSRNAEPGEIEYAG